MTEPETELIDELLNSVSSLPAPELLLAAHEPAKHAFERARSIDTAMYYGALLLNPRLQPNCVRLEALVHMAMATSDSDSVLSIAQLRACFDEMSGGICGLMEDPSEDVFVSNLVTARGNYLVLEGTWESGAFFLQRFVDILESTPETDEFVPIRESTYALLQISDVVCRRAGLSRNMGGDEHPLKALPKDLSSTVDREMLSFSKADLERLGIAIDWLTRFALTAAWKERIKTSPIGRSPLQFLPLVRIDDSIVLLLPTAVSFTLRTHLTNFLIGRNYEKSLHDCLCRSYVRVLRSARLLRRYLKTPLQFRGKEMPIAETMAEADTGRYIHFLCFTDTLCGFATEGISGNDPTPSEKSGQLGERITAANNRAREKAGYRKGMTLAVYCGIGRSCGFEIPETDETWTVQVISAAHLVELSCVKSFSTLKLWKILEAVDRLRETGVELFNVNGLLNLISWVESNDGHLVPHSQTPKGFRHRTGAIQLPTNSLRKLRLETTRRVDRIGIRDVDGKVVPVRRPNDSFFPEDDALPLYLPEVVERGHEVPFVFQSNTRAWWCVARTSESHRRGLYERWAMLKTWLPFVVAVLDPLLTDLAGIVKIDVKFQAIPGDGPLPTIPSPAEIRASIQTEVDQAKNTVNMTVGEPFERGQRHETNISERALVAEICKGFARLAGRELEAVELNSVVDKIMPNEDGRHMHALQAQAYREYVAGDLQGSLIQFDELDSATLRVGLAFRVEDRESGRHSIKSKRQATKMLNKLVEDLENELCAELRQYDRRALLEMAMRNHETAIVERNRWMRTAKANLAIRHDDRSAIDVIAKRDRELSGAIFPSRVLLELAVCECPLTGGSLPGHLDFTLLMELVSAIMEFGGWSDAIYFDAMPPNLTITALGDIQADRSLRADVMMPFSKQGSQDRIDRAVEEYEDGFHPPEIEQNLEHDLAPDFLKAWREEFGFDLVDALHCWGAIEDLGIEQGKAVFFFKHSELMEALSSKIEQKLATAIVAEFTLATREEWRQVPEGYDKKDIQIWRFRRQLSSIRRPILQLDSNADPALMIAPGFIRDCFAYVARSYFEGSFPIRHYQTSAIRQWHDKRLKERGENFANEVAQEIRNATGWRTQVHVEVKSLIQSGKDPEYGDVRRFGDVDVLAWNERAARMLIIECKHLYYGKTYGEVAEQLRDYLGKVRVDGKREKRDDLRKHLDRLDVLRARNAAVFKTLNIGTPVKIEGWIIFKNPVPMLFSWKEFERETQIGTFDDIRLIVGDEQTVSADSHAP